MNRFGLSDLLFRFLHAMPAPPPQHLYLTVSTLGIRHLNHLPYIDTLPPPSTLLTPLHFTTAELALLKGTNMLGACLDRRKEWEHEWRQVRDIFVEVDRHWAEGFTW